MQAPAVPPLNRPSVIERAFVAEAQAGNVAGGREHFLHARPAARAFVADDDHVAGLDLAGENAGAGVVLALENHARTFKDESRAAVFLELRADAGGFHHAAFRRKLAVENRETAVG